MTEQITPQQPRSGKPSPVLIVFLIFPLLGLIAALAIALADSGALSGPPPTPLPVTLVSTSLIDQPAPNFELAGLQGESYRLSSYRGRVVFLNFWATWCEPCQRELPTFVQYINDSGDDGAVILAVNVDEPVEAIEAYFEEKNISGIPVLLDDSLEVYDAYAINRMPTTYIIDPAGVVRYVHYGEVRAEDIAAYMNELSVT